MSVACWRRWIRWIRLDRVICGCLSAATSANYPLQHPHIRISADPHFTPGRRKYVPTHVFHHGFYTCFYCDGIRRAKAVEKFEEEEYVPKFEKHLTATWNRVLKTHVRIRILPMTMSTDINSSTNTATSANVNETELNSLFNCGFTYKFPVCQLDEYYQLNP